MGDITNLEHNNRGVEKKKQLKKQTPVKIGVGVY